MDMFSLKGLSFDRLRAFIAVFESESVTRAAGGDPTRQSQYSRQIRELEEALGVKLFDRRNRRLMATAAARQLALMTKSYGEALADLSRSGDGGRETIRIGAGESVLEGFVYPKLPRMFERYPGADFVFAGGKTEELVRDLLNGSLDLAIIRESARREGLESVPVGSVTFRLAVPRSMLPEGLADGLRCLAGLPVATLRSDGDHSQRLIALAERFEFRLRVVAQADSFRALAEMVRAGSVAAVLPEWLALSLPQDAVAVRGIKELSELKRELVVVHSANAATLRTSIADCAAELAQIWRM